MLTQFLTHSTKIHLKAVYYQYFNIMMFDVPFHNLKVVGSNPTPATNKMLQIQQFNKIPGRQIGAFVRFGAGQLQAKISCMTIERIVAAKTIGWR